MEKGHWDSQGPAGSLLPTGEEIRDRAVRAGEAGLNVPCDSVGTLVLKVLKDLVNKLYILKNYTCM